jgi:four helix bundle protein
MDKPHKKLDVWRLSMELVRKVYRLTAAYPDEERYGLAGQMRRAAVSIPSNLAEGAARQSNREFKHFLSIARGSLSELDTQLDLSEQLGLVSTDARRDLDAILVRVDRMLHGLYEKKKRHDNHRSPALPPSRSPGG